MSEYKDMVKIITEGNLGTDPYGQGWIAKVKLSDPTQLDSLLDYETYQQFCKEEGH